MADLDTRFWQRLRASSWARGVLAASSVGALAWALAQSQVTSEIGSFLEYGGQVIGPVGSPTYGSTNDVNGSDIVRWTSYFNSRLASPFEAEGTVNLPANHTWVAGSALRPANTSLEWKVGNSWTSTEPANGTVVSSVRWVMSSKFKGATSTISKAVNFSGTGDGYRVVPYGEGLYVINHHNGGTVLKCRSAADGQTCANWPANGYAFNPSQGAALTTSGPYLTPNIVLEAVNYSSGEMFVGLDHSSGPTIVCTNLNTRTGCGSWLVDAGAGSSNAVTGLGAVGSRYFVLTRRGNLVCFDIERRQTCGTTYYANAYDSGYGGPTSVAYADRLFFSNNTGRVFCHDPALQGPCQGWSSNGLGVGGGRLGLYPFLNADGSPRGACNAGGDCVTINAQRTTAPATYTSFIASYGLFSSIYGQATYQFHNMAGMIGPRVYGASQNTAACYSFATQSMCGTWLSPGGVGMAPYSTRMDPTRPNCLMILGDSARAMIFDPTTGGECKNGIPANLPDFVFDPIADYFKCDPSRANIRGWGQLRLSPSLPWGGARGLDRVTATLKDATGTLLPALYKPVRNFPTNGYQLDLSDVPYSKYPALRIGIELHSPSLLPSEAIFGIDLTYDGDPIQVCVASKAPAAPDCQTGSSVTVNTRAIDYSAGVFQESLTASTVMSPGGLSIGYSAVATPTSPRAVLNSLGPRDPKTYVLQGRWALQQFSGDLWAFGLTPSGKLDNSSYLSAQAFTASPGARPMFTAAGGGTGLQPVKPLQWSQLTSGQQAWLNLNQYGVADGKGGARLDYLRGIDGSFRARGGKSLGPVINSSPAMLLPSATLSLSERNFPGYTAYRSETVRPHPIALYGGNDGALHAYEVRTGNLREAWSYVPEVMLRRAANYSDPNIVGVRTNPYFVDNIPMVGHVNVGGNTGWRAVAVMTYGRGARAITALDVTRPDLAQGAGVLFEYSNTSDPELKDLGYIISQPVSSNALVSQQIVQLAEGSGRRPAVLVGNGINSNDGQGGAEASGTGKAVLYAFYLDQDGSKRWQRWAVDELWPGAASEPGLSLKNGLSTPTPVDVDNDGRIDVVYAGDQQGNLWRFDIRNPAAASVTRLFKTEAQQPLSQAPFVSVNPQASGCGAQDGTNTSAASKRCWQVVFATGAPLSPLIGSANVATQSIYSVLDKGTGASVARASLTLIPFESNQVLQGVEYRALKPTSVAYKSGAMGWVIDLQDYEHGVGAPRLQPTGLVMFSSVRPTTPDRAINVCIGARSWLNEVDPINGYSAQVNFDTNGDGQIDGQDRFNPNSAAPLSPSGMSVSGAQFGPPAVLLAASTQAQQMSLLLPSLGQDTAQAKSWSGGLSATGGSVTVPGSNSAALTHANKTKLGRMTWREVY